MELSPLSSPPSWNRRNSALVIFTLLALLNHVQHSHCDSGPPPAPAQSPADHQSNIPEMFTKMCEPFFPHVKPLHENEAESLKLDRCFSLVAYPLGKRNHVHVSFRQWPLLHTEHTPDHCKDFIVKNISVAAFNKHNWPFGRWLANPMEVDNDCMGEDEQVKSLNGSVQDCTTLTQLDVIKRDPVKTITQSPSNPPNIFKAGLPTSVEHSGGICMVWTYIPGNFSFRVASELGGLSNAENYFGSFTVTFVAELLVVPAPKLNLEPFLYSVQTNTWKFDGMYARDHHRARCHSPASNLHKNFRKEMFTRNITPPVEFQHMILKRVLQLSMKKGQSSD